MGSGKSSGGKSSGNAKAASRSGGAASTKVILWIAIAGLVAVVLFLAFRPSAGAGIHNIYASGVDAAKAKGAQIIDVRSPGEFEMGHIPGAKNVPVDQIGTSAASWNKDATYVVYCATGARSAQAVQTMQAMGFKNIDHFSAGIQAWNGPLEKGGATSGTSLKTSGKPVLVEFFTDS
jgi:rhodanese-related sulfurtransferase